MTYTHDPMLAELRQIRKTLWEESGHDIHTMLQIIEQEAKEIMCQYGKIPAELNQSDVSGFERTAREITSNN